MNRFEVRTFGSIAEAGPDAWAGLRSDGAEGFAYWRACEKAKPESFSLSAIGVFEGGRLIAGAPVFETHIALELVVDGFARSVVKGLQKIVPRLSKIPLVGIGSPYSHNAGIMFAPSLSEKERSDVVKGLACGLDGFARRKKAEIFIVKDVPQDVDGWAGKIFEDCGFARVTSLPVAVLTLPDTEEAYIKGLSGNMRSNLRRRLKRAKDVRVEIRHSTEGLDAQLNALRESTLARASSDYDVFEQMSPKYFQEIMSALGEAARLVTYWLGDKMIGFSLVLLDRDSVTQMYNGMCYPEGPDNGLFYFDWMTQVRLCLENDIRELRSGVTTYLIKARLGCKFRRSFIYVNHTNRFVSRVIKAASPWINFENSDPGLIELGKNAPFE